jgi:aldehyde dehydrogenase
MVNKGYNCAINKDKSDSPVSTRCDTLPKIAQLVEDDFDYLATVETIVNDKVTRENRAADHPLTINLVHYFLRV